MSDKRKHVLPWVIALLIGLAMAYVASFGPVCALAEHRRVPLWPIARIYRPLVAVTFSGPEPIRLALRTYVGSFTEQSVTLVLDARHKIHFGILERLREDE